MLLKDSLESSNNIYLMIIKSLKNNISQFDLTKIQNQVMLYQINHVIID